MSCISFNFKLIADSNDRISKAIDKYGNSNNSKMILATLVNNEYLTNPDSINKLLESTDDSTIESYITNLQNTVSRNVNNTNSRKASDFTNGFDSVSTNKLAKNFISNIISDIISQNKSVKGFKNVSSLVQKQVIDYVKSYFITPIATEKLKENSNFITENKISNVNDVIKFLETYGGNKGTNFANLVKQVFLNTNNFIQGSIENNKKLRNAVGSIYINEDSIVSQNEDINVSFDEDDNVNKESARWDKTYKSFTQTVDGKINDYFDSLYDFSEYSEDVTKPPYDTDNNLGVATKMSSNYIIAAMYTHNIDKTSLESFINGITNVAKSNKRLYGLGAMVAKMKADRIFANRIYTNFSRPSSYKSITYVENGVLIPAISNSNVDGVESIKIMMLNSIKTRAANLNSDLKKDILETFIEDTSINNLDEIEDVVDGVYNAMTNYLGSFDKDWIRIEIENYTLKEVNDFVNSIKNILNKINSIEYKKIKGKKTTDYSEFNVILGDLDPLANIFIKHDIANVELNSQNAEGELGSNIVDNNRIQQVVSMLTSDEGLIELGNFISRSSQYDGSVVFYGIKDSKGNVLVEGLFEKNVDGTMTPTKSAKTLISTAIFDGIQNNDSSTGVTYKDIVGTDFGMTAIAQFFNEAVNQKVYNDKRLKADYFIPTPSDANKTYIIKNIRLKIDGLISAGNVNSEHPIFRALYQMLDGEINNFIENLNNVITISPDGISKVKTSTDGLFANYHRQGNVIHKNGRLVGNAFEIIKLFDLDNISVNNNIKDYLYSLININEDGAVTFDPKTFKVNDDGKIEFIKPTIHTNVLNSNISEFIKSYYKTAPSDIKSVVDTSSIKTKTMDSITDANLAEFAFNNLININSINDLFNGDSKFYKDYGAYIKRAKQLIAGGTPYIGSVSNLAESTFVNVADINVHINEDFRSITANNVVRSTQYSEDLKNKLITNLEEELSNKDVSEEYKQLRLRVIDDLIKGISNNTTVNDAQSYITIEEFIRRRYLDGTLDEYRDILNSLIGDNPVEGTTRATMNPIQVQKNFYFDVAFDDATKTYYSRQIKNAEFVLIPSLIKGTELEQIYNFMKDNGIDQLNTEETSKAAKKDIVPLWDKNGNVQISKATNFVKSTTAIEKYSYKYLYKQQQVAEHMFDETNKLGSQIMRKILDNLQGVNKDAANKFVKSIVYNIQEDYGKFLQRVGWYVDNKGITRNIKNDSTELDYSEFYSRVKEEAVRLGLDDNFIKYLDVDVNGRPILPNFMNNVSTKLENVFQAMFTSIGKQKINGWHAAQVTNIGATKDNRKLRYLTEDGQMAAEVLIPRWSSAIPSREEIANNIKAKNPDISNADLEFAIYAEEVKIIEDMTKSGTLDQIGYRIPTEGKQSTYILKPVGFIDERLGSTIVIPDEWVTQTGSDFDVDSIYGVTYKLYRDKKGRIRKYEPSLEKDEYSTKSRYFTYVNSLIKEKLKTKYKNEDINSEIETAKKDIDKLQDAKDTYPVWKDLMDESNELFLKLPADVVNNIKKLTSNNSSVQDKISSVVSYLYTIKNPTDIIIDYLHIYESLDYITKNPIGGIYQELKDLRNLKNKLINDKLNEIADKRFNAAKNAAARLKLMSFDEFNELDIIEQQPRNVRDNMILDSMIEILNHSSSVEEIISRSHAEDLTFAKKATDKLRIEQDVMDGDTSLTKSSVFNITSYIKSTQNATDGRSLKGASVAFDNFASEANQQKAVLGNYFTQTVIYSKDSINADAAKEAYGNNNVEILDDGSVMIHHNKLSNSNNGRNVVGKLIQPYTAQTTAYSFDIIKEGSIHNVVIETLGVVKTLTALGCDYQTTLNFMQSAGITRIVSAINKNRSAISGKKKNVITEAIRSVIIDLNIKDSNGKEITAYTPLNVLENIIRGSKDLQDAFVSLYGSQISFISKGDIHLYAVNDKMNLRRYKSPKYYKNFKDSHNLTVYEAAAIDIATILAYTKLNETATNISLLAAVSKPDRTGATQNIRSAKKIVAKIAEYSEIDKPNSIANTVIVKNEPILKRMFPNISSGSINVFNSTNPILAAHANNVLLKSIENNSNVVLLENSKIHGIIDILEFKLGRPLTDKQYDELKKYIVSEIYYNADVFNTRIITDENGNFVDSESDYSLQNESDRLFGRTIISTLDRKIDDIYNPTKDDIEWFSTLTPAQKVIFIQSSFYDNAGIFNDIKISTYAPKARNGSGNTINKLYINDQINNIDELVVKFNEVFTNENPFVKLAAIDLLKYSFVVDGHRYKKGSISKIIDVDILNMTPENGGYNSYSSNSSIIDSIMNSYESFLTIVNNESQLYSFIDKFVRSHPEIIRPVYLTSEGYSKFASKTVISKLNGADFNTNLSVIDLQNDKEIVSLLQLDLTKDSFEDSDFSYIKLITGKKIKKTTLYKVVYSGELNNAYLYPLNLLEQNEVDYISAVNSNNIYLSDNFYQTLISEFESRKTVEQVANMISTTTIVEDNTISDNEYVKSYPTVDDYDYLIKQENVPSTGFTQSQYKIAESSAVSSFTNKIKEIAVSNPEILANGVGISTNILPLVRLFPNQPIVQRLIYDNNKTLAVSIELKKIDDIKVNILGRVRNTTNGNSKWAFEIKSIDYEFTTPIPDSDVYFSTISSSDQIITNSDRTNVVVANVFDKLVANIIKYQNNYPDSPATTKIKELLKNDNVNLNMLIQNPEDSLFYFEEFFKTKATHIFESINNFESGGVKFREITSANKSKFYDELVKDRDKLNEFIDIILQYRKLDSPLTSSLEMDSYVRSTNLTKEKIRNSFNKINSIISNVIGNKKLEDQVNNALDDLTDYMFARTSSNPLIVENISTIKESLKQLSFIDRWISSPTDVSHTQIQVVINDVFDRMNEEFITTTKVVNDFQKKFDSILKRGRINFDKIIDKDGYFRNKYTRQFIKDKTDLDIALRDAMLTYGYHSKEYNQAKLNRDRFYEKHVNQVLKPEYYTKINDNFEKVVTSIPDLFSKYQKLYNRNIELKDIASDENSTISREKTKVSKELRDIVDIFDDSGNLKSESELKEIKILEEYINNRNKINRTYYKTGLSSEILQTINEYKEELKTASPERAAEIKSWLEDNFHYEISYDSKSKVYDAFDILSSKKQNNNRKRITHIINKYKNSDGIIDYSSITDEDLAEIKKLQETSSVDTNNGESKESFIKDSKETRVFTKEFWDKVADYFGNTGVNKNQQQIIKEVNDLLRPAIDENGNIRTSLLFKTVIDINNNSDLSTEQKNELLEKEYTRLNKIGDLYRLYSELSVKVDNFNKNKVKVFETVIDGFRYEEELNYSVNNLTSSARKVWHNIFSSTNKKGALVANSKIFGKIVPKEEYETTYIDTDKTKAKHLINESIEYRPVEEYFAAKADAESNGTYDEWFDANHYYDTGSNSMKPLSIWTKMAFKETTLLDKELVQNDGKAVRSAKSSSLNKNYVDGELTYIEDSGYDNTDVLTKNEEDMFNLLKEVMNNSIINNISKKFIESGRAPIQAADKSTFSSRIADFAYLTGFYIDGVDNRYTETLTYDGVKQVNHPMSTIIRNKSTKDLIPIPKRSDFGIISNEDYEKKVKAVNLQNDIIRRENDDISKSLMSRDWRSVFSSYIEATERSKIKQDSIQPLMYLIEDIRNTKVRKYTNSKSNEFSDQEAAIKIVETFFRRYILDEYSESGYKAIKATTKWLQHLTSTTFMSLNILGGISNLSIGKLSTFKESISGEHYGLNNYFDSFGNYANIRKNNIIKKLFNIVDVTSRIEGVDSKKNSFRENANNIKFIFNSIGERFIHNESLFLQLNSNRVINNGDGTYSTKTLTQYQMDREISHFASFLQDFDKDNGTDLYFAYSGFIELLNSNGEVKDRLNSFKTNVPQEFIAFLSSNYKNDIFNIDLDKTIKFKSEYLASKKKYVKESKKEFESNPTVYDSIKVNDKGDYELTNGLNTTNIASLRKKIVEVNNKNQGVYDKLQSARLESKSFGNIIMQFHKHIKPLISSRVSANGFYNENRGSVEKGSYISLLKLLRAKDARLERTLTNEEVTSLKGINSFIELSKNIFNYSRDIGVTWHMMSPWERNNISRTLGDMIGIGTTYATTVIFYLLMQSIFDEDEIEESLILNVLAYSLDRVHTSNAEFSPIGIASFASSTISNPLASASALAKYYSLFSLIVDVLFGAEPDYKTGDKKGESKVGYKLKSTLPYVRSFTAIERTRDNNKYYKTGMYDTDILSAKSLVDKILEDDAKRPDSIQNYNINDF